MFAGGCATARGRNGTRRVTIGIRYCVVCVPEGGGRENAVARVNTITRARSHVLDQERLCGGGVRGRGGGALIERPAVVLLLVVGVGVMMVILPCPIPCPCKWQ